MPVAAAGDAVVLRGVQARGVGDVQQRLVLLVQQAPHTQRLRHDIKFDLTTCPAQRRCVVQKVRYVTLALISSGKDSKPAPKMPK